MPSRYLQVRLEPTPASRVTGAKTGRMSSRHRGRSTHYSYNPNRKVLSEKAAAWMLAQHRARKAERIIPMIDFSSLGQRGPRVIGMSSCSKVYDTHVRLQEGRKNIDT